MLYKMRTILIPVIVKTVNHDNCMRFKATTVQNIAMRIRVTVGMFKARDKHEGPKVTTVTRMEALRLEQQRLLRGWRRRGAPSLRLLAFVRHT